MTLKNQQLFWQQFRDNFVHVGAVLPSSPALGRASAFYLAQKQGPVRVLEAGAGTGAFTREIIPLLADGDSLDVVEINPHLTAYLHQRFQHEPQFKSSQGVKVHLVNADLLQFPFVGQYDYIIFSLPLTNFPPFLVQQFLELMMHHLKPNGVFSYVKYIFIGQVKYYASPNDTKANMDETRAIIQTFAQQYQFDRRVVMANVPPTWVHYWRK